MASSTSTTCKVCSNRVKYDNPTYPYCHHHQHLKDAKSISQEVTLAEFDDVRKSLYNARKDFHISGKNKAIRQSLYDVNTETRSNLPDFDSKVCAKIIRNYGRLTDSLDMNDSETAFQNRDSVLENMSQELNREGISHSIVHCTNGAYFDENGVEKIHDHKVILIDGDNTKAGYSVIVDPATMAPLHGLTRNKEEIEQRLGSGSTSFGDGISIRPLAEFGRYSSVQYEKITKDDGTIVWDNSTPEDKEAEKLRKYDYSPKKAPENKTAMRVNREGARKGIRAYKKKLEKQVADLKAQGNERERNVVDMTLEDFLGME